MKLGRGQELVVCVLAPARFKTRLERSNELRSRGSSVTGEDDARLDFRIDLELFCEFVVGVDQVLVRRRIGQ